MVSKKFLKALLFSLSTLFLTSSYAATNQSAEKPVELPRSEIFSAEKGKPRLLKGEIINGRYYAPQNVFSCQADDFGEGEYLAQDALLEIAICVGFYSTKADFKKAEVLFMPQLEKKTLGREALKDAFDRFGIGILEAVDNAQGIEILSEEMIDGMFFTAISIEKMSVLKTSSGKHMSSARGYLIFYDKDKLVVLSNQKATLSGQKHAPEQHIEELKQSILNFRKTFEFGAIPASFIKKKEDKTS